MIDLSRKTRVRPYFLLMGILALALAALLAIPGCAAGSLNSGGSTPAQQSGTAATQTVTPTPSLQTGSPAIDFTLKDLNDKTVSLSDFLGKTVYLNFWATWCPPCRAEMPDIEAAFRQYQNSNVVFLGINIQEPKVTVQQFVQQGGYNWTFLLDTTGAVTVQYNVLSIPTSVFIDKAGIIRATNVGGMTLQQIEAQISKAMD